ncbi:4Fe-4S dicluster domain-containing protein [Clostridium algoriphilum]|uniref:4Fe-4S dicluster domain-containing protein n=1 Tax=Clostridium algoriphilum TaxID=198347 RepID=UPI001CF55360|nr:4Fe-4S dicluster domain-containing protein [Clostridium algoriphilum]MCB2293369.1 4Fe-4S dicluster domain-containing protein [Clostridium algoriphilum]
MMKKISKSQFSQLFSNIDKSYQLFLPVELDGKVNFDLWQEGDKVNIEKLKTNISPKSFIFPQSETYMKFKRDGKKLKIDNVGGKKEDYVIFGVRHCDASSFKLLDNVFLEEPVDRLYEQRREKGTIVTMACFEPEENCFCTSFGIKPETAPKEVDVTTWDLGESILWQSQTQKGEALTEKLNDILEDATDQDKAELNKLQESTIGKVKELPLANLDPTKITGELNDLFESEIWQELSERCLGCGACTFVCPTCHCYDVADFKGDAQTGERFRCWDSCMFSDFTLMAHGNIRKTQKERFRQRFMHKLVYYPNNHEGVYACVGCGRCVEKCPVHLDIVKVIKKLGGE